MLHSFQARVAEQKSATYSRPCMNCTNPFKHFRVHLYFRIAFPTVFGASFLANCSVLLLQYILNIIILILLTASFSCFHTRLCRIDATSAYLHLLSTGLPALVQMNITREGVPYKVLSRSGQRRDSKPQVVKRDSRIVQEIE